MLNRDSIVKLVKELDLPLNEYWVTAGAGLVLHGVKENTSDIDLGCTPNLWENLLKKGYTYRLLEDNSCIMKLNDSIEIIKDWLVEEIVFINRLPVGSLESIKKQKAKLGREKDIKDIAIINEYIQKKK